MEGPARSTRKIDNELQDKLYTNIALLNITHQPSAEFKSAFKKDMFAKSNKAAFFHVIHYLLTILNPELAKRKLVTWPTGNNSKRENKFRTEVLLYLNELNNLYEDADLPKMMSSHLLAPGGHRFIYFMYKLSQLVLIEELKREDSFEILNRPKSSNNTDLNEKAFDAISTFTKQMNSETQNMMIEFEHRFDSFKKRAEDIEKEKCDMQIELKELDRQIETEESIFRKHKLSEEAINERLEGIEKRTKVVKKINSTSIECKNFIEHLKEYSNEDKILDLAESLKNLNINMRRKLTDLPVYEVSELESYLQKIEERREEIKKIGKNMQMRQEALVEAMRRSEETLKNLYEELKED